METAWSTLTTGGLELGHKTNKENPGYNIVRIVTVWMKHLECLTFLLQFYRDQGTQSGLQPNIVDLGTDMKLTTPHHAVEHCSDKGAQELTN